MGIIWLQTLNMLHISAECYPIAKVDGVLDVAVNFSVKKKQALKIA